MKKRKALFAFILFALFLLSVIPASATKWATRRIDALYRNIRIVVDDKEITPTDINGKVVEPFIIDGTTYVPLRAIGEALGKNVSWDSNTSTVNISTPTITPPPDYSTDPPAAPCKNVEVATAK